MLRLDLICKEIKLKKQLINYFIQYILFIILSKIINKMHIIMLRLDLICKEIKLKKQLINYFIQYILFIILSKI